MAKTGNDPNRPEKCGDCTRASHVATKQIVKKGQAPDFSLEETFASPLNRIPACLQEEPVRRVP